MAQATTRVYHPSLNAWYDVSNPDEWVKYGWRKTRPDHVDDSEHPLPKAADAAPRRTRTSRRTARSRQQEDAAATAQPTQ